ncbi:MAG: hypothetical protein WCQ50_16895 [Spirochaetota bacterium]
MCVWLPQLPPLALGLALVGAALGQQLAGEVIVSGTRCVPELFVVGQEVLLTARLEISGPEPEPFSLSAGSGLALAEGDANPELIAAVLSRDGSGWVLSLRFIPWAQGPGTTPPLSQGGLVFPELPFETLSTLAPGTRELAPLKPQREPAGMSFFLYGFAALALILVFGSAGFALWVIPAARALLARLREREAIRSLERTLDWLEANAEGGDAAAFHALLAQSLRRYLARRLFPEAAALTPSELSRMPADLFPGEGFRDELAALLGETDRVRFALWPESAISGSGIAEPAKLVQVAQRVRLLGRHAERFVEEAAHVHA